MFGGEENRNNREARSSYLLVGAPDDDATRRLPGPGVLRVASSV